jgi:hypothetical protein
VTSPRFRRKRPRFNGSPSDHAPTEQWLSQLRTGEADGATWPAEPGHVTFGGVSDIGVMAIAIGPAGPAPLAIGPAPLAGYRPEPASFPALPAAAGPEAEPLPDWERDLLDEEARQMALPVLAPVPVTERAVIGDELRLPVIWCEMPRCINWDHDPDSLGECDTRERAIARGWRTDALGRLACPECQQTRSDYRTPRPVTCHHPEVPRRWYWHDPEVQRRWASGEHISGHIGLSEEETFRLGIEAELGHRVTREDFALACAIGDATFRHHRAVTA